MLPELHQVLQDLIYREGRIDRSEVDVAFEVPSKDFVDKLVRPTVDLHLLELQENTELRNTQFQTSQADGKAVFRAPPRRVDLRYIVTALTTNADDGFRLLWRVLGVLMRTPELPVDVFPSHLKLEIPIPAQVAQAENGVKLLDVWSAVGSEPRPAFGYVLTVPMDLALSFDAPLVLGRSIGYHSLNDLGGPESRTYLRGVVRGASGQPLEDTTVMLVADPTAWTRTDREGNFTLRVPKDGRVAMKVLARDGSTATQEFDLPATAGVEFRIN